MPASTHDPDPSPRRSRLEDEVLEILVKADRPPTPAEHARSRLDQARFATRRSLAGRSRGRSVLATPLAFIVGSLALAIAGAVLRPVAAPLGQLLAFASAAVLFALWFDRRPRQEAAPRWRGRDLDGGPRLPDLDRFRERWRTPPDR